LSLCLTALIVSTNTAETEQQETGVKAMSLIGIVATGGFFYFAIDSILLENPFQFW
jgi:hypothetical protein